VPWTVPVCGQCCRARHSVKPSGRAAMLNEIRAVVDSWTPDLELRIDCRTYPRPASPEGKGTAKAEISGSEHFLWGLRPTSVN